jgi:4-hydroxy-tetrahydrodipicolinate reductase
MKNEPRIALIGYGRMGQELHRHITDRGWPEPFIVDPLNANVYESIDDLVGRGVEVCVEFTTPNAAVRNILACMRGGLPVVSGTTGWDEDRGIVAKAVRELNGACIHASNFSIGIYLFRQIAIYAAGILREFPEYDIALHEVHHAGKVDSPSGTALALARSILDVHPGKRAIETSLADGGVKPDTISISSSRVGHVFGEHQILIDSPADSMEFIHHAKGRRGLAEGALLAAQWICDKHGMFTFEDLIHDITKA